MLNLHIFRIDWLGNPQNFAKIPYLFEKFRQYLTDDPKHLENFKIPEMFGKKPGIYYLIALDLDLTYI